MIRYLFSRVRELVSLKVIVIVIVIVGITSCSSYDLEINSHQQEQQLHEVTVSLTGVDFTLVPTTRATVPEDSPSGITRASDATDSDAGITRIALKVFNSRGEVVADTCQIASMVGEGFNKLGVQLPTGPYTFVAVAHSATADNVQCATITSATEATLPEAIIPTLYAHVETVTVTNANKQAFTINMGKRINSTLHLTSTDIVPDGVSKIAFDINPTGTYVGNETLPHFNPATGLIITQPRYRRAMDVTAGEVIDVTFNILLPADPYNCKMDIFALGSDANIIADYTRSFTSVPFQRAFVTNASGLYFRYVSNSSLSFDTTTDSHEFAY